MRVYFEQREIKVPILTYHSIGVPLSRWAWNYLTVPFKVFSKHLSILSNRGYKSMTLDELVNNLTNHRKIPQKTVVITFDDGYLDNYTFAFPILKKYGMKATFFIPTDFVDNRKVVRPTLLEKNLAATKYGYMSWNELRVMSENGMDIQSHTMTHTWHFKNSKIIDFRTSQNDYYWIDWNDNPSKKCDTFERLVGPEKRISDWRPVYCFSEALTTKKYLPNKDFDSELMKYAADLSQKKGARIELVRKELFRKIPQLYEDYEDMNEYETEKDFLSRIRNEIFLSKEILEAHLRKRVSILCWPNGAYGVQALKEAMKAGYIASTHSTKSENNEVLIGTHQMRLKRLYPMHSIKRSSNITYYSGPTFVCDILLADHTFAHSAYRLTTIPYTYL